MSSRLPQPAGRSRRSFAPPCTWPPAATMCRTPGSGSPVAARVGRARLAAARYVVDRVGDAVDDVEPVGVDRLERRVGVRRDLPLDERAVSLLAVVHQHPGVQPRVAGPRRESVAGRQRQHVALLPGAVDRCARPGSFCFESKPVNSGSAGSLARRASRKTMWWSISRSIDGRAVLVHDVGAHRVMSRRPSGVAVRDAWLDLVAVASTVVRNVSVFRSAAAGPAAASAATATMAARGIGGEQDDASVSERRSSLLPCDIRRGGRTDGGGGRSRGGASAPGHELVLHGALDDAERDDWAWASEAAARDVADGRADRDRLLLDGHGRVDRGNKVNGVRAALCGDAETARGARSGTTRTCSRCPCARQRALLEEILDAWFGPAEPDRRVATSACR